MSNGRKTTITSLVGMLIILTWIASPVIAQDKKAPLILIKNVSIFNGTSEKLITGQDVVISGNVIEDLVSDDSGETYDQVIDGKGGYLTPGLIDSHYHAFIGPSFPEVMNQPFIVSHYSAAMEVKDYLERGITTIREMAGPGVGLQIAIEKGYIPGPRVYPSGMMITQTSGHMDFRNPNHLPKGMGGAAPLIEMMGTGYLADGPDEVRKAAREQLSSGATQIKLAVTGSVTGTKDPIFVAEYTVDEIRAAVEAAADFGTYVAVHAYNPTGIRRALEAGAMTVEHGNLVDEETMKLLVEKGAFWIPQVWADEVYLKQGLEKAKVVAEGTDTAMRLAKKYNAKIAFGTDLMFDLENRKTVMQELVARKKYFSSPEIMIQATGNGGALLALSGKRNPYGKLGVIEKGAMADLLIYSSNPMTDVAIAAKPEDNLMLIMKDGKIVKNAFE